MRENTAAINPPRALWVPFMFGRPFGVPGDAAFQRRVVMAAFDLLSVKVGPVLVDYLQEAPPPAAGEPDGQVCPVGFGSAETTDLASHVMREVDELAQWYDLAVARRGRTTVGLSGFAPADAARFLVAQLEGAPQPDSRETAPPGETMKLVCEDLRAYYSEAAAARPGTPKAVEIQGWFWRETAMGKAFAELQRVCLASDDTSLKLFGERSLVPRVVAHELGLTSYTPPASENVTAT